MGVGLEGVACDVCHKIWDVPVQRETQLPYPNTPGVLSIEFRRPSAGHQLFIGPFDGDVIWDGANIKGVDRFLEKYWTIAWEMVSAGLPPSRS